MHFTFLIKALGIVVLGSISTAHAYDSSPYPAVLNDTKYPKGSSTGFVHNSYTYNAPLAKFTNTTQSFFHVARYVSSILRFLTFAPPPPADRHPGTQAGAPATKTIGADNIPGATLAVTLGGGAYNETLTAQFPYPGVLAYTVLGAP
ncbi:hypothetical protein DFH09DRAFT_1325230 [Mycena vulgaris]|nr:hypothetical protein DFH09DRAFT_1325230 [Mycena vulgaris]